jgi:hypothetical protein
MLNGLVKIMDDPTRNTLAHLSRCGFHRLKNESDPPRQVCLPRTARAALANYLSIVVFRDNQNCFSSAAAQSEAGQTIPKRLKSLLDAFNTDAAVLEVPASAEFASAEPRGHLAVRPSRRAATACAATAPKVFTLVVQSPRGRAAAQPPRGSLAV